VIAGVPAGIRALCRAAPSWRGSGRLPDTAFELPAQVLLVLDGVVLVSAVRPSGRVVALALLAPGDLWMDEPERHADEGPAVRVDALGRSMVALPDRAEVLRATASPAVAGWVTDTQLRRALAAERRAAHILSLAVEERILAAFVELARVGGAVLEDGRVGLTARISQERLAWVAGTSRETANRVVASLVARGALARVAGRYVLPVGFSVGRGAS
jgi:CRP-like cAMP-binding protein